MMDDDAVDLARAESVAGFSAALQGLDSAPDDFVVATPTHVFVGGAAEATIDGQRYRHTGDGTFTRHDRRSSAPRIESGSVHVPAAAAPMPPPPTPAVPPPPTVASIADAPATPRAPGEDEPSVPDRVVSLEAEPVLVRGLLCQRDHLVHPEARMCPLCGDNMQNRSIVVNADGSVGELGPRPPLGVVILPDGRSYQLQRTTVVGRLPDAHPDVQAGLADGIAVSGGELSRAHFRFVLDDWRVLIEDLGSTNGSWLGSGPSARQLQPNAAVALHDGVDIHAGSIIINYQPTSAAV